MSGWGCICDNEAVIPLVHTSGKSAKNGNFFGAGGTQVFLKQGAAFLVEIASSIGHPFCGIRSDLSGRINATYPQVGNGVANCHSDMGCRIGRGEMYSVTSAC